MKLRDSHEPQNGEREMHWWWGWFGLREFFIHLIHHVRSCTSSWLLWHCGKCEIFYIDIEKMRSEGRSKQWVHRLKPKVRSQIFLPRFHSRIRKNSRVSLQVKAKRQTLEIDREFPIKTSGEPPNDKAASHRRTGSECRLERRWELRRDPIFGEALDEVEEGGCRNIFFQTIILDSSVESTPSTRIWQLFTTLSTSLPICEKSDFANLSSKL